MNLSIDSWITIIFGILSVIVAIVSFKLGSKSNASLMDYSVCTEEIRKSNEALAYLEEIDRCEGKLTVDHLDNHKQRCEIDYNLQTFSMFLNSLSKNYFENETELSEAISAVIKSTIKSRGIALHYLNNKNDSDRRNALIDQWSEYKKAYNALHPKLIERRNNWEDKRKQLRNR